jgi:hypothetical protein
VCGGEGVHDSVCTGGGTGELKAVSDVGYTGVSETCGSDENLCSRRFLRMGDDASHNNS